MSGHNMPYEESGGDWTINDPGSGQLVTATQSGVLRLTASAAATRTITRPLFIGQRLHVHATVNLSGTQVTFPSAYNAAGNTALSGGNAGSLASFVGSMASNGTMAWVLVANQGFTLA